MTEASAFDRALARTSSSREKPRDPRPLAGLASCSDLPLRQGLAPATDRELQQGHLLDGRFLIREVIGRSGMAVIYRAEDKEAGGEVAIKVPLMKVESDPVSFGRFQREERIGSALSDPLLLRFVPMEKQKSRPYIVTELLDGCTLTYVMHRTHPVPEPEALRIASVICQALAHMHGRGVIHRDLKPDNVMIRREGSLCLMDFGLSEEVEPGHGLFAGLAQVFGTPEYMAPEQVSIKRNDERTDIYSLGVILYQMLTGVLPFPGDDPWVATQQRVNGDPVAPRSINPLITPQAEEIVLHAMRRRPEDRYPGVSAFQAELDAPEKVHVTGLASRLEAPKWRLSLHGTPILTGLIIGVGFLSLMVGMFFFLKGHGRH
jgi:serine/threonine-protein kinase